MKKIIKIVIGIIIIIWVGLEIVNYFEYKEARKKWIKSQEVFYIPMPGPSYNLMVINKLYKIFPKINPNYGIDYKPVIYLSDKNQVPRLSFHPLHSPHMHQ